MKTTENKSSTTQRLRGEGSKGEEKAARVRRRQLG